MSSAPVLVNASLISLKEYFDFSECDEIAKKLSESKIGEKNPRSRAVKATNVSTGEVLTLGSALEAIRELIDPFSEDHSPVTRRCRGKIKKLYHDVWKFEYI